MPKLPRISGREVADVFEKAGYTLDRSKGSHHTYVRAGCKSITLPIHAGKTLGPGLLRRLIRDAGMTVEEFIALNQ
jgi:predicted RNA binding protein YcfA (HicA-like mRNA interferase family)